MSKRIEDLTPFYVMEILELAKELERRGERIIHLEVGEPDFATPEIIKRSAIDALERGETFYTNSMGITELRNTISWYYQKEYGVAVDPENILVTSGTSPAMLIVFLALVERGEEVIITEPAYPCYKNFIKIVEAKPVTIPLRIENGFVPDIDEIKKKLTAKTKAIVVNSPNNPTGSVYPPEVLKEMAELGITMISDEIYHGLTYGVKAETMLKFSVDTFVINGFSKAYAMTGFRLGYLIFPSSWRRTIQNMHQNFFISANSFVQWAGVTALREAQDEKEKLRKRFEKRRTTLLAALKKYNLAPPLEPRGAFYVMVDLRKWIKDSLQFAKDLLKEKKVAVTPGMDFGEASEGMIRLAYTVDEKDIVEGIGRIVEYLEENYGFKG